MHMKLTLCKEMLLIFSIQMIIIFVDLRFRIRQSKSYNPAVILYTSRLNFSTLTGNGYQPRQNLPQHLLLQQKQQNLVAVWLTPKRNYGMLAVR